MNFLFNLLIFSLPLGVIFRITPFQSVAIYPYDLIAGLIFLFFIFKIIIGEKKILAKKPFVLIAMFLLIGFVSLIMNSKYLSIQNFFISSAYLLRYAAYISIIFAAQFLGKQFMASINRKLIIAGSTFLIAGFIQYFYYPNLRNLYYLGWDEHLYRFFSTFLDPNFAGAFLVLFLIFLSENIFILLNKKRMQAVLMSSLWLLILLAILLTHSRSAFIMLIIGISTLLALHKMYRFIVVAGVVFVVLFLLLSNRSLEGLNPFRIASVEARIDSTKEAISIIEKNPIIGVGFNAYRYARIRYGLTEEKSTLISNAGAGTDNSYLFVLATTGIMGFVIFLDFWINIIKIIVRNLHSGIYSRVALASIAGLLINTIFINSLFYPPIMLWVFMLFGLTVNKKR